MEQGAFEGHCDAWLIGHDPGFSRRFAAQDWIGMTLPSRYGGHERSHLDRFEALEELLAAGAPVAAHWIADRQTGPLLLRYGTEQQRARFLPAIARGECYFAIGMSEPDSGSDLASVRTSAREVDDGWLLNGTKIWTSHAQRSDYMIALVRTSPSGQERRAGLSQFIVDLHAPGIDIRPIKLLSGHPHFNEVVLTDVFVPEAMLIGKVGEGWAQVMSELGFERSGPERFLSTFPLLRQLVLEAGTEPDERLAHGVGELASRLWALRRMSVKVAQQLQEGQVPESQAVLVKDLGTQFENQVIEVARTLIPPASGSGRYQALYGEAVTQAPGFTLRGGTSEILRGIAAKSSRVTGPVVGLEDEQLHLLVESAEAAFRGDRDVLTEVERAGLADARELGPLAAALMVRVAAYRNAPEEVFERLMDAGPLLRAVQLAGASARIRDMTIEYSANRRQFGQPINRFQAVQHLLAALAGESAAADAIVEEALGHPTDARIAAAKVVAGHSAGTVARLAHQIHGAIGFTEEHPLHRFTTRIWRWRDQDGTESEHAIALGKELAGHDLWEVTTE